MTRHKCIICESGHVKMVNQLLRQGTLQSSIVVRMQELGETISQPSLSRHKRHMEDEASFSIPDADLDEAIEELRKEAARAPVTLRPSFYMLMAWYAQHRGQRITNADAIKAAQVINQIAGLSKKQALLLDFIDAKFEGPGHRR